MTLEKPLLCVHNPLPDEKRNGFATFRLYVAVKAHFNDKYDLKKYNLKLSKVTYESYLKRNDRYFFEKIAEKFTIKQNYMIFVHNFIANVDTNTFDLMDQDCIDVYNKRNGKVLNAQYNFTEDVTNILNYCEVKNVKFGDLLIGKDTLPMLLLMLINNTITFETVLILDSFLNVIDKMEKSISDYDLIWPSIEPKIRSYKKILEIDVQLAKKLFIKITKSV